MTFTGRCSASDSSPDIPSPPAMWRAKPRGGDCDEPRPRTFNDDEVRGRTIYINQLPYRVTGVVEDVSPFFTFAHSDVWSSLPEGYSERVQRICRKYDSSDGTGI